MSNISNIMNEPPPLSDVPDMPNALRALGARLRAARKAQRVSAVAAAEAAGMSRVTLHRIEAGEPSVSIGHWAALADALGLVLTLAAPASPADPLPPSLRLEDYPALRQLAWQTPGVDALTPAEALALYERNWRHVDQAALQPHERALIARLAEALGGGRLLV